MEKILLERRNWSIKRTLLTRNILRAIILVLVFMKLHRKISPVLIPLFPIAFIAGNFFCGWFCPLGTIQELIGKIGSLFLKRKFKMPRSVQRFAQCTKYALAVLILALLVLGQINSDSVHIFPFDAYQSFFAKLDGDTLSAAAIAVLGFVLFLSLFMDRPFCNYLCQNSIEYALPSWTRVFSVKRNRDKCIECGNCDRSCPMNIRVSETGELRNLQCINCFHCIAHCPIAGALSYGKTDVAIAKLKNLIARVHQ
jgi:polyferredoxin